MSYSSDWQRFSSLVLRCSSRLREYEARGLRNLEVPPLYEEDWKRMGKNHKTNTMRRVWWRYLMCLEKREIFDEDFTQHRYCGSIFTACFCILFKSWLESFIKLLLSDVVLANLLISEPIDA